MTSNDTILDDMPTKDATDFRYHRLEKDKGFSPLQVCNFKIDKYLITQKLMQTVSSLFTRSHKFRLKLF